jgi:hypothetical protein
MIKLHSLALAWAALSIIETVTSFENLVKYITFKLTFISRDSESPQLLVRRNLGDERLQVRGGDVESLILLVLVG